MRQDVDPSSDLPEFAAAMRRAYSHRPAIPSEIDARLSAMAAERFAAWRRSRMAVRWAGAVAAGLAAVIALAIALRPQRPAAPIARATPKNYDMVDALLLAKHLAAHDAVDRASDVNGDGVVDQRDVDAIAAAAVRLRQTVAHRLPTLNALGLDKPIRPASAESSDSAKAVAQVVAAPREGMR